MLRTTYSLGFFGAFATLCYFSHAAEAAGHRKHAPDRTISREMAEGRDLFQKVWETGVSSPHGGDGLGPLFNENSCVGCHNLGGVGGAGENDKNVEILTAFVRPASSFRTPPFQCELEELHPGFKGHDSVMVHRHSTDPAEETRLETIRQMRVVQTRENMVALSLSKRSTPALFGLGRIDALPDAVLLAVEKQRHPAFPEITGRVSQLRGEGIGRFGWKGQTSRLEDFVLAACSNELGLEVPRHHQLSLATTKEFDPAKLPLDLNSSDCQNLTSYVASLPMPTMSGPPPTRGFEIFRQIGCAECHVPQLGPIQGIYSDLLLHDLGELAGDAGGSYGGSGRMVDRAETIAGVNPTGPATPNEWRTPPLWGVASSAPYMHDGRAANFNAAIRMHGGEAEATVKRYSNLSNQEQIALMDFLFAMTAPGVTKAQAIKDAETRRRERRRGFCGCIG